MIQWREEVRSENQQQEDPYAEFVVHDDQNNLLLEAERKRSFPSSSSEDNGRLSIPLASLPDLEELSWDESAP